ncbi:MAG TPA: hypothetical protein V6C81_21340 [Planktothrix sp.]
MAKQHKPAADRIARFEQLWGNYIDKLARIQELKEQGRYGYQIRMPRKALKIASDRLKAEFPEESKGLVP